MAIQPSADCPHEPTPIEWFTTHALPHGSELSVAAVNGPLNAEQRWRTIISGHLYLIAGWHPQHNIRAGYFGQSSAIAPGRTFDSLTHWTIAQRAFIPRLIALLRFQDAPDPDTLRLIESRVIMRLSAAGLYLTNTHTSAGKAGSRLIRPQRLLALHYANALTDALSAHVLTSTHAHRNIALAPNSREAAVQAVLQSDRAIDTREVYAKLTQAGWTTNGRTPEFTLRRDLNIRERETPGTPRVFTTTHRHRRVYWNPAIPKALALQGYDRTHPRPTTTNTSNRNPWNRARPDAVNN